MVLKIPEAPKYQKRGWSIPSSFILNLLIILFRDHPFKTSANFSHFWPLPLTVGSFLLLSVGQFGKFLTPPPLKNADILNGWSLTAKIQQTKKLVTCQRFGDFFYLGLSGSILQFRQKIIKLGVVWWLFYGNMASAAYHSAQQCTINAG